MNSLKHGIFRQRMVHFGVPHQDSNNELAALRKSVYDDLKPVGVLEEMLVDQVVHAHWRLRQVTSAAANNIKDLEKIARYENMLQRQLRQAMTELKRLQKDRTRPAAKSPSSASPPQGSPKAKTSGSRIVPPNVTMLPLLKDLEEVTFVPRED